MGKALHYYPNNKCSILAEISRGTDSDKTIHLMPDLVPVFRADARLLTSLTAFGARRQSLTLEVMHQQEKLAPESGVGFMAPISGAGF